MEMLTETEIDSPNELFAEQAGLINEGKALAEQCGAYIAKLREHTGPKTSDDDQAKLSLDQRWISIGATDLQRGFMAVLRGITQPTTF